MNISNTMKTVWSVLSTIYHLGCAGITRSNLGRAVFGKQQSAQRAAQCLGVTLDDLTRAVFQGNVSSGTLNRNAKSKKVSFLTLVTSEQYFMFYRVIIKEGNNIKLEFVAFSQQFHHFFVFEMKEVSDID